MIRKPDNLQVDDQEFTVCDLVCYKIFNYILVHCHVEKVRNTDLKICSVSSDTIKIIRWSH
jgi:hypothetical protein